MDDHRGRRGNPRATVLDTQAAWGREQGNLGCVVYSGGKSLHGWSLVEGWSDEQRYNQFSEAIDLGIRDINTWRICQPVRLPGGWNSEHGRKQKILLW